MSDRLPNGSERPTNAAIASPVCISGDDLYFVSGQIAIDQFGMVKPP